MVYRVLEKLRYVPKTEYGNYSGKIAVNLSYANGCKWKVFEFDPSLKLVGLLLYRYSLRRFGFPLLEGTSQKLLNNKEMK